LSPEPHPRRRRARELALQALYAVELSGSPAEPCMQAVFVQEEAAAEEQQYAETLVRGTLAALAEIDRLLAHWSESWPLRRMAAVDRNLLRLAAYELLHQPDVPRKVVLNEAVEIAKRFSDPKSPSFVNAILDKIERPAGKPETGT
jgi:transcription antitermination protein NusB